MARHSQVHRLWRANELKPHLRRTFKLSKASARCAAVVLHSLMRRSLGFSINDTESP
jgi:hypothetical protein